MPKTDETLECWFLTGSLSLYGEKTLAQVAHQSQEIVAELNAGPEIGVRLVWKPVLVDADAIRRACIDASSQDNCIGVIAWMHTFSPAKAWIAGLDVVAQALVAPSHPVELLVALGRDRHGLHEPQPGGARRPGVRLHRDADGDKAKDGCRTRQQPGRTPEDRCLGTRRHRMAGGPRAPARPLWRQHARRGCHRGRQGRGTAPPRGRRSTPTA